jgi:hypothetical protein
MSGECERHEQLVTDIATIKADIKYIKESVCRHISEGEKEGGFRDRLLIAEKEISVIKNGYWKACIVSGILGGLLGKLSPDFFNWMVKAVFAGGIK